MTKIIDTSYKPGVVLGTTGLKQTGGFIDEEFLTRLRGRNAIRLYNEMVNNSPILAAAIGIIKLLIRQADWRVEPADESDEAKAQAEDTEAAFEDMEHTFEDFLSEVLSMLWAGYSVFEVVYKIRRGPDSKDPKTRSSMDDGLWGWRKIEIRAQDTVYQWIFDDEEDGGLLGYVQVDPYGVGVHNGSPSIPMGKSLLFRTESFKGNPEGKSLLRPAVIPYWYVKRIQEFEAIGIERNLAGLPIMEVPARILLRDASPADQALRRDLEKWITQVRVDERWGGLIPASTDEEGKPTGFKFTLMSSSGRKLLDSDVIIKRHRAEMLMIFLEQFLVMGTGESGGSRAVSNDMTRLFGKALHSTMDSIAAILNLNLIPRRQRLNGVAPALNPFVVHGDVEGPKLAEMGAYLQALANSGTLSANPALERKLLEIAGLPQPPEETAVSHVPELSEGQIDHVSRSSLTPEQVKVILTVNKALKSGQIPREVAISTLMHTLGLDEEQAAVFIPAEEPEEDLEAEPGAEESTSAEPGAEPGAEPAEPAESETPTEPTDEDESVDDDIGEEDDEDEEEKKKVD